MMGDLILLITMLISLIGLTGSFAIIPYISRKNLSFGISIPEDVFNDKEVCEIRRKYRNIILLWGLLLSVLLVCIVYLFNLNESEEAIILAVLIIANLIVNGMVYIRAHKKMKMLKEGSKWKENVKQLVTVNTNFRKKESMISPLWFVLYIIIIASTVIISLLVYDSVPEQIPMKYNTAGEVIRYAEKTYGVVLSMPMTQLFIMVIFIFAYYSIQKSKQQIDPANPEQSYRQNILFRKRWSAYLIILGALMELMFASIQFSILGVISTMPIVAGTIIFTLLAVVGTIVLAVFTGQSGSRIKTGNKDGLDDTSNKSIMRDDDKYWKWGVFYYNPDDPSIFIEKRLGIGWTMNFGRPASWLILLGLLGFIGIYSLLSSIMF